MTLSTSIGAVPPFRRSVGGDTFGWDWSATTHLGYAGVVDDLLGALGAETVTLGKGMQGWAQSMQAHDAGGYRTGAVYFGGGRDDVHVVSSSSQAHAARQAVVDIGEARTARVDTCVDTLLTFEDLAEVCYGLGGRGTKVTYMESRTLNGQGQGSEAAGRTLYVGAPTSSVRVRVYEKWLESPGEYQDGVNRVEVQLRPPSRTKEQVSGWGPVETFCASKLTQRLAEALEMDVAHPASLQKSRGTPDLQRSLEAMGEQYGGVVGRWLTHSGGDYGQILHHLTGEASDGLAG